MNSAVQSTRLRLGLRLVLMNKILQEWSFHLAMAKGVACFSVTTFNIVFTYFDTVIIIFIFPGRFFKYSFNIKCRYYFQDVKLVTK